MSVARPIGRTPRQVAGPGADDAPDPDTDPDTEEHGVAAAEVTPGEHGVPDDDVTPGDGARSAGDATPDDDDPDRDVVLVGDPEGLVAADREIVFGEDPDPATDVVAADLEPAPAAPAVPDPAPGPDEGFMGETGELRRRWGDAQAAFVDDPRAAVEHADEMVSEAVAALQAYVEQRREDVAETWRGGQEPATDTLVAAFQRYRDLFDGVLST